MPLDLFAPFKRNKPSPDQVNTPTPPAPAMNASKPNRLSKTSGGRTSTSSDPNHVADAFGHLTLGSGPARGSGSNGHANKRRDARHSTGGWVGGFAPHTSDSDAMQVDPPAPTNGAPAFPVPNRYAPTPSRTPMAMPMPMPQPAGPSSLTMQYALGHAPLGSPPLDAGGALRPPPVQRPHSDSSALPAPGPHTPKRPYAPAHAAPSSVPAKPALGVGVHAGASPLGTPLGRRRAASSPPSPTTSTAGSVAGGSSKGAQKVQCSATTKNDKRCTRMVVVSVPLSLLTGEPVKHYCHQHLKTSWADVKFYSHKDPSVSVEYERELFCAIGLSWGFLTRTQTGYLSTYERGQGNYSGRRCAQNDLQQTSLATSTPSKSTVRPPPALYAPH